MIASCHADPEELPVVARGRYLEIASNRDEPVCGGTAAHMDGILEAAFAVLGETPPDDRFLRYEWRVPQDADPFLGAVTQGTRGGRIQVLSNRGLIEEHELVHAVTAYAWPGTNAFLSEGLAVLLDAKRDMRSAYPWPSSTNLDMILAYPLGSLPSEDYELAWFLVSQIVREHGFDGLRDLWHAVPAGASASEVRDAYARTFGASFDELFEPIVVELPEPAGPSEFERRACDFTLCPIAAAEPWDDDRGWTGLGPIGCEDDPEAVGTDEHFYGEGGNVWRDYTLGPAPRPKHVQVPAGIALAAGACGLRCDDDENVGFGGYGPGPYTQPAYWPGSFPLRIEVRTELDELPTDMPGRTTITPDD